MDPARPLRILHLTAASEAGGLSRYLYDLCDAMHGAGHEVAIAGERGSWHERFAAAPWPWIDAPLQAGPIGLGRAAKRLREYIAGHPIDLIHTHYRKPTLVARRIQRHADLPILYTLHSAPISLRFHRRWLTDFGDHTHVAGSEARDWLVKDVGLDPQRVTLIPHGVHTERFPGPTSEARSAAREALGLHGDDVVALYVGYLGYPKNEDWALDLAARSTGALPKLRVLMAGSGPDEPKLRQRIKRENLQDRVRLLGYRDPLPLYHAADVLLLPSNREGFSYVCAEAMAAGLPVIRTRTSGASDMIQQDVTGRTTPIDRDTFVEQSIDLLRQDRAQLQRIGSAAAARIRGDFTFEQQLERTLALYRRLIDASGKRAAGDSG